MFKPMKQKKNIAHLSNEERHVLSAYLKDGLSIRTIARKLGRMPSAMSYEIKMNSDDSTREGYDPIQAQMKASLRRWEANKKNPLKSQEVMSYVLHKLSLQWSPKQISQCLKLYYPNDSKMRVSHETIYQFINSPEGRELKLVRELRRGKLRKQKRWKLYHARKKKQNIPNRVSIDERPSIVDRKIRYGDWETDSMLGKQGKGKVLTVQKERKSQFIRIRLVADKSAKATAEGMVANLKSFPTSLRRTITFDNGTENATHFTLHKRLGAATYFCDPYASWQKGSVENVIGLIRQYFPKGISLNDITDERVQEVENLLNDRPRECLGFKTPRQVLSSHIKNLGVQIRS